MDWSDDDEELDEQIREGRKAKRQMYKEVLRGSRPSEPGGAPAAGAADETTPTSAGSDSPIPNRCRKYQTGPYWPKHEDGQFGIDLFSGYRIFPWEDGWTDPTTQGFEAEMPAPRVFQITTAEHSDATTVEFVTREDAEARRR